MENIKTLEIDNRKFEFHKMNAKAALKVAKLMMSKIMPAAGPLIVSGAASLSNMRLDSISNALDGMTDAETDKIIDTALAHCYEVLRAGAVRVLNPNGTYGVENVENDPLLVLRLTIESVAWSVSDFFDGSRWNSLFAPLLDILRPAEQTSTI